MMSLADGTLLALGSLCFFWILGALLSDGEKPRRMAELCLGGFCMWFSVFQLIAVPMKVLCMPLLPLTMATGILAVVMVLAALIWKHRVLTDSLRFLYRNFRGHRIWQFYIVFACLAFAFWIGTNTNVISDFDAASYIGRPVASIYTNTCERVSPISGKLLNKPDSYYLLNTDTLYSAVVCQMFHLHPLMERKYAFTSTMVLMFEMALWHLSDILFRHNVLQGTTLKEKAVRGRRSQDGAFQGIKQSALFLFFANLALGYSYSIAGTSHYFFYRTYEGKAICSYFYPLVILGFCLRLYLDEDDMFAWGGLFLCGLSGVCFTNSALFIIPSAICIGLVPTMCRMIRQRKKVLLFTGRCLFTLSSAGIWLLMHQLL